MAERFFYDIELDTYCCDGNQLLKPAGALQVLQEAGPPADGEPKTFVRGHPGYG